MEMVLKTTAQFKPLVEIENGGVEVYSSSCISNLRNKPIALSRPEAQREMFWLWSLNRPTLRGTKVSTGREVLSVPTKVIRQTMSANLYKRMRVVKMKEERSNKDGYGYLKMTRGK